MVQASDLCNIAPEEEGARVEALARDICARGWGIPSVFILELHKPITTLALAGTDLASPLFQIVGKGWLVDRLRWYLASRERVERLIAAIEIELTRERKERSSGERC